MSARQPQPPAAQPAAAARAGGAVSGDKKPLQERSCTLTGAEALDTVLGSRTNLISIFMV